MFISIALGDWPKKTLVWYMSENILPMFSSRSFMVSSLLFRFLNHFESIFLYGVREGSLISLINMQLSNFPSITYWRDHLFFIVYSYLLCCRLINHKYVGLFLVSLLYSIHLYACFCASTILFWLLLLCSIMWSLGVLCQAILISWAWSFCFRWWIILEIDSGDVCTTLWV